MLKLPFDIREFDPNASEKLATWSPGDDNTDFFPETETLYKTGEGRYFIVLDGGLFSRFYEFPGHEIWFGGLDIQPVTEEEALNWCIQTANYEVIDEHFSS